MTEVLRLYTREDCALCEEMEFELRAHPLFSALQLQICDVDADADMQRRYGLRVPVLVDAWNDVVCEARFDAEAFAHWCAERRRDAR